MPKPLELVDVTFGYETAGTVLFDDLSLRFDAGWCGIVGANGAGKTTLVHLLAGQIAPQRGRVISAGDAVVCPQRTDDLPADLETLLDDGSGEANRLRGQLGIEADWPRRWSTLSHGERKRAQIACALWKDPRLLALDEPTNHVDVATREMLLPRLRGFRGVGLLVSHDRALLDALCRRCLFFEYGAVVMRPGNYTEASRQAESDRDSARRAHDHARKEQKRLGRSAAERRHEAAQADAKRSKRKIGRKDHDAKARIDAARVSGKDGQAGRLVGQIEGRLRQADERRQATRIGRERTLGITMRGTPARRDALWRTAGEAIDLGGGRRLELPELAISPEDRIGVRGPNGAGKSTLIERIVADWALPPERLVYLAQEIDRRDAATIMDRMHALPSSRRGDVLAAIDCLGSDPQRLLETGEPSPGEVRKLVLAMGLAREPNLIVMDEPTNHLDLPSIECLQRTLAECRCGLLLVSHDEPFLSGLAGVTWTIARDPDAASCFRLRLA
ncbi:MAG: ABC-F family ATP-binding cassette domain-containing protein [Planctomycetes bacterium]|nr:ABC-F family ATP-binding cassette domain-containing protein [Planctomycetota bacterium]